MEEKRNRKVTYLFAFIIILFGLIYITGFHPFNYDLKEHGEEFTVEYGLFNKKQYHNSIEQFGEFRYIFLKYNIERVNQSLMLTFTILPGVFLLTNRMFKKRYNKYLGFSGELMLLILVIISLIMSIWLYITTGIDIHESLKT